MNRSFLCTCISITLSLAFALVLNGCDKPNLPKLSGAGGLTHDITQVRRGMSPNEVRRVMGSGSETTFEEGLKGIDGGNYTWVYPEGKIYFGIDGVTRVEINR